MFATYLLQVNSGVPPPGTPSNRMSLLEFPLNSMNAEQSVATSAPPRGGGAVPGGTD